MAAINTGSTAWMLISTALVMLMTPGLAFFYGGLVRRKNILSIMVQCFALLGVISLQWVIFGYSLAFGPDHWGVIGGLSWSMLHTVGLAPNNAYAPGVPQQLFMAFQMMFAIITPALIIGAFAERMKFSAFLVFSILWAAIVYDPITHWVWGIGGFLRVLGALDFAGGAVVHISAGTAALAAALVIGKRKGYPELSPPHNLPFAVLGAGLLWFGWFGFNGGSALSSGTVAVAAFISTHMAAAAAATVWAVLEWIIGKKPTALGIISGAIAGLATVTPASGFVTPIGAMAIGALAGIVCYVSVVVVKARFGYDDSLDAFGVHGVGGALGILLVGFWATTMVNPAGANGLFHGGSSLIWHQVITFLVVGVYSFVVSFVLLKIVDKVMGLRVTEQNENIGLDLTQHSESAYTLVG